MWGYVRGTRDPSGRPSRAHSFSKRSISARASCACQTQTRASSQGGQSGNASSCVGSRAGLRCLLPRRSSGDSVTVGIATQLGSLEVLRWPSILRMAFWWCSRHHAISRTDFSLRPRPAAIAMEPTGLAEAAMNCQIRYFLDASIRALPMHNLSRLRTGRARRDPRLPLRTINALLGHRRNIGDLISSLFALRPTSESMTPVAFLADRPSGYSASLAPSHRRLLSRSSVKEALTAFFAELTSDVCT